MNNRQDWNYTGYHGGGGGWRTYDDTYSYSKDTQTSSSFRNKYTTKGQGRYGRRRPQTDRQKLERRDPGKKEEDDEEIVEELLEIHEQKQSDGNEILQRTEIFWYSRQDGRQRMKQLDALEEDVFGTKKCNYNIYQQLSELDSLPVSLSGEDSEKIEKIDSFHALGLHLVLIENLYQRCGYVAPTPVQKFAFPVILRGRDLMASSQTGSGKTCAFITPVLQKMLSNGPPKPKMTVPAPVALCLAPTRELATQIFEESRKFAYKTGIICCVVYGGQDVKIQKDELKKGVDILVATPGRLIDMSCQNYRTLQLGYVQYLIFDEADRMFDMGFENQINRIMNDLEMSRWLDDGVRRQTILFSATFPRPVQTLTANFLHNYLFLTVGEVGSTNTNIQQKLHFFETDEDKFAYLKKLVNEEKPDARILIFVETRVRANELEVRLYESSYCVTSIHGDRSQTEREEALRAFREGEVNLLVATGVAARGLDIPEVGMVIQYEVPKDVSEYTHRIGRTGRAGRGGVAVSFLSPQVMGNGGFLVGVRKLMQDANQQIPEWFHDLTRQYQGKQKNSKQQDIRGGKVSVYTNVKEPSESKKVKVRDAWDDSDFDV